MYFIIDGHLGMVQQTRDSHDSDEVQSLMNHRKTAPRLNNVMHHLEVQQGTPVNLVGILREGDTLGADSFIKGAPNQVSAICMTQCQVGVMDRYILQKSIDSDKEGRQNNEIIQFLENLEFLEGVNQKHQFVKEMFFNTQVMHFRKGQSVFEANEQCNYLFIIYSGVFSVH